MAARELIKGRFQKDKKRARNSQKRWYHGLSSPFPGGFEPPVFRLGGDCSILLSYGNKGIFRGVYALKIGIIFWCYS